MKRLSDFKNEEALDLLCEILEPASEIMTDEVAVKLLYSKIAGDKMKGVKRMITEHKSAVMHILAALEGVPVDQFECSFLTLPTRLLEILNDKELLSFFMDQQMQSTSRALTSAMETTEEGAN